MKFKQTILHNWTMKCLIEKIWASFLMTAEYILKENQSFEYVCKRTKIMTRDKQENNA